MDEPDRRWRWWLLGIFALGPVLFGLLVTADPPVQVGDALIWSLGAPCLLALLAWNWWISFLWRKFMFRDGPPPRTTYAERVQLAFMGVPREFLLQKPEEPDAQTRGRLHLAVLPTSGELALRAERTSC